jgi:hypothetical protein
MQACGTRMARTWLAQVRTLRFGGALIVCISLLMVLMPPAHGFSAHGSSAHGFAVASPANTTHGAMHGAMINGTGVADTPSAIAPDGAMAAPSNDKAAIVAKAYHHAKWCGAGGDPSGDTASASDACMAACCCAIVTACRHHAGVVVSAEPGLLPPIPPSAGRGGIHPPPRSDRMI